MPHKNPNYMRDYYRSHVEHCKAISRRSAKKRRDEVFNAYGGYKCTCECGCKETNPLMLTIDHINGGGRKHREQVGGGDHFFVWLRLNGYPEGYRVLCYNCNCGRNRNRGVCPRMEEKT